MAEETSPRDWIVYKFGGTSLATVDRVRHAADLVAQADRPLAVVVSAMSGVTDRLLTLSDLATNGTRAFDAPLSELIAEQRDVIANLLPNGTAATLDARLSQDAEDVTDVLRAAQLMRSAPQTVRDLVAGYGETWSARLMAHHLQSEGINAVDCNARDVLVVTHSRLGPVVDWEASAERFEAWRMANPADVLVITGFIATTPDGVPTTLGRNGSDYSAAIFGKLLDASGVTIWTDVDGVMSADPRYVPDAQRLTSLSYREAMELAYFGAKVIHPQTLQPAVEDAIPVTIRTTFSPDDPSTRIHLTGDADAAVKGFSTVDDVALVNLEGTGMIGVPGIARRLFDALEAENVSVILISQGSSEHSICFAVPQAQADAAREATEQAFYAEMHQGQIQRLTVTPNCSILAVVGDQMSGTPGVAATFFGALGQSGVNVRAIAQGSSERNISAVVDSEDAQRALRSAHAGFYLSKRTLSIGIIGIGNVGAELLDQIEAQRERLLAEKNIDLRVRGISNTKRMVLDEHSMPLDAWREAVAAGQEPDLEAFVDHVQTDYHPHTVLVDCTASSYVSSHYEAWLERGIHVVTPNKLANTDSWDRYQTLRRIHRRPGPNYLYETTVGAGLPIIQTVSSLIETGDHVQRIEGILSGTLSYLFNAFDGERPFSDILIQAKEEGFTEPDPRDDLSGMDVARKVVILAREIGLPLELGDVTIEGLVPDALQDGSVETFLRHLPEHDDTMTEILRTAQEEGQVLRFVGAVSRDGEASVRLRRYPKDHAFARISHTDNIVRFQSDRYQKNPLIVQGPGAGPAVTAAGVFADMLRLIA